MSGKRNIFLRFRKKAMPKCHRTIIKKNKYMSNLPTCQYLFLFCTFLNGITNMEDVNFRVVDMFQKFKRFNISIALEDQVTSLKKYKIFILFEIKIHRYLKMGKN